ncbi:Hydroxyacid-oxoacid transhydrogenase, mitochondrial [Oopsacas minuta]|uniref:hydroxyacid-oxoacid transhydrogenase n=1 Tax=Oopsacas minuta TaxID=111878 RepID=A0AAV7KMA6_9METZ|nr:Hydroxyacid-oxoacid transhydrogenase, mitochondrial [Oopsacas minuta]
MRRCVKTLHGHISHTRSADQLNSRVSPQHRHISNTYSIITTDYAYETFSPSVRIGKGATREVGMDFVNKGVKRVLLFTDKNLIKLLPFKATADALRADNVEFDVFSEVRIEPTEKSFREAIHRAQMGQYEGFLAVGGGSVMDTAKVARLFDAYRDRQLIDFIPEPIGLGEHISRPLKPLICIPTTSSGSEVTGNATFYLSSENSTCSISSQALCPSLAIVDPINKFQMPKNVAIFTGLGVLCRALEAYTALPHDMRSPTPSDPRHRSMDQGSSPMSDIAVVQTLRLIDRYFLPSVESIDDTLAKSQMSLASVIKGAGFSNAGVHICHALSYAISSKVIDYNPDGYPTDYPLIPHGLSAIITAPAVFSEIGYVSPDRCMYLAQILGANTGNVKRLEAGRCLAGRLCYYMKRLGIPNGLSGLGFTEDDIPEIIEETQKIIRLTCLSPIPVCDTLLEGILHKSLRIYDSF